MISFSIILQYQLFKTYFLALSLLASNQCKIFYYTPCITPKHVTSWRNPSTRHWVCRQHSSFLWNIERSDWQAVGNSVSDITGLRFEAQTSRPRYDCITVWLTGRVLLKIAIVCKAYWRLCRTHTLATLAATPLRIICSAFSALFPLSHKA